MSIEQPFDMAQKPAEIINSAWTIELPADFSEPDDRGDYVPYEPTPIVNMMNPHIDEVRNHQRAVSGAFTPLFEAPSSHYIPTRVREMINLDRMVGDARRSTENIASYCAWASGDTALQEVAAGNLGDVQDALLRGTIRPQAALDFLQKTSLETAEIAKITHPYGYRIGYVADARIETDEAIEALGGVRTPRILSSYTKIQLQPNLTQLDKHARLVQLHGFLSTYKRHVGYVMAADGRRINIIERQSAALRIDEGSKDIPAEFTARMAGPAEINGNYDPLLCRFNEELNYKEFFETAIQRDAEVDYLVPLSTVLYAAKETHEQRRQREEGDSMAKANERVRRALGEQASSGGILFIS